MADLIERYRVIHPFDPSLLDGDGYVMTVRESTELKYLEHRNVVSSEIIFTPPDIVAILTAKSRFGRLGLSFLNAAKIHSGWIGRVVLEVVNLSNDRQPIMIEKGEPFMHVVFLTREGKPSPYSGEYMFQHMSKGEIDSYLPIMRDLIPDFEHHKKIWFKTLRIRGTQEP
ncbi:MAG: hypothetical protein ACE5OY_01795 [Candidatus Bathyarchaeia archaeon]